MAAFISYGEHIYQFAGLTSQGAFANYSGVFNASLRSFRELSDRKRLEVQPDRIKIYRTRSGESLRSLAGTSIQSRISLEQLSSLNRIDPTRNWPLERW